MKEIVSLFLKLGTLGFGGPIAILAMLEEEVCRKRKWITGRQFGEILAICKLLPGPISTQVSIYVAYLRGGVVAGVAAGIAFILPSFLLVLGLSYFYAHSAMVSRAAALFTGFQVGALAVIVLSTGQLASGYRREVRAWLIATISAVLILAVPRWEPVVIFAFGMIGIWGGRGGTNNRLPETRELKGRKSTNSSAFGFFGFATTGTAWLAQFKASVFVDLFWVCFKAGAFVFGTGLAIVPLLEGDTVRHFQWLTHSEFMDGLAIGQVTPGPVVITATFIGFKVAGFFGALVATFGMFLPSFINILVILPRVWKRVSGTPAAASFASWAIPSVIGGIAGSAFRLGWLTLTSPALVILFLLSLAFAIRLRPPGWLLIPLVGGVAALGRAATLL